MSFLLNQPKTSVCDYFLLYRHLIQIQNVVSVHTVAIRDVSLNDQIACGQRETVKSDLTDKKNKA